MAVWKRKSGGVAVPIGSPVVIPEFTTSDPAKVPVTTQGNVTTADVDGLANKALAINNQTGTAYTPVASDAEALVRLNNANPITVTLPEGVFALGESVTFEQSGAGQVSFAAGANAAVQNEGIFDDATRGQYAVVRATLVNDDFFGVGGDVWQLFGDLERVEPLTPWIGTQAEYDALGVYEANRVHHITDQSGDGDQGTITATYLGDIRPTPLQVQRGAASGGAVTLAAAPKIGNTLLLVVKAEDVTVANIDTPAGWTELESAESNGGSVDHAWKLFGKVSDGSETTSPTPTFNAGTPAQERTEYHEWSGLAALGSVVDVANSILYEGTATGETSWNPASTTPANNRVVFLCLLSTSGAGTGPIVSDWANLDATYNHTRLAAGHAVVLDGAALDTDITWTNQRVVTGAVIVLNGET